MSDDPIVVHPGRENRQDKLPYPIVQYPAHYGVFIGFKSEPDGGVYFCTCAKEAIKNYVRCEVEHPTIGHIPSPEQLLTPKFPKQAAEQIKEAGVDDCNALVDELNFESKLCHRCNGVVPEFRYCHEMYGTVFVQKYGWYVNQKQYEYGVCGGTGYLHDVLPKDIEDIVGDGFHARLKRYDELREKQWDRDQEIQKQKNQAVDELGDELDEDLDRDEEWRRYREVRELFEQKDRLPESEEDELEVLEDQIQEEQKNIEDTIENEVRQAFGHYEKGNRWTSETILFQLIESNYSDYTIERHYRPDFLDGLELDIYISEVEVGIEYQGIQHYEVVDHWGGEEGLWARQERDQKKKDLCDKHGVELVCIRYNQELNKKLIEREIDPLVK